MLDTLLITLREGLEAALIIGIILAFLANTKNRQWFKQVWIGTGAAVVTSVAAGAVLFVTVGTFEGRAEEIFEGSAMLLAAAVLTWMIFWMRKQAGSIKDNLQSEIKAAIDKKSSLALVGLAFIAVVREGIETALFLFAATRETGNFALSMTGGFAGLTIAVVIGYLLYKGTARLNLKLFFNVTGGLLIVFAAGLIAYGIHEFQEAGVVPIVVEHIWDINGIIPEKSTVGSFLTAVFGYNGNPSLIEVVAYLTYLAVAMLAFFTGLTWKKKDLALSENLQR